MKRKIILTFLFYLFINAPLSVLADNPLTEKEFKSAQKYAKKFLSNYGVKSPKLNIEEYKEHILYLTDKERTAFVIMVRDQWSDLVTERVLAFSSNGKHGVLRKNGTMRNFMLNYETIIADLDKAGAKKEQIIEATQFHANPIMPDICWRQFLFNTPTESVLSGCGAVAVGQLMKFYQWPDTIRHDFAYLNHRNQIIWAMANGTPINWSKLKNKYSFRDPDSLTLDTLMRCVATTLRSDFGHKNTSSNLSNFKRAMVTHFGYSAEMRLLLRDDVPEKTLQQLICDDIKQGRPAILCAGDHLFICDGIYNGFMHLNMGWSGDFDGWYRFPITTTSPNINKKAFLEGAVLGITPKKETKSKIVTLSTPGTLAEQLTEDEYATLTDLTINGKLNGHDIRLLRKMLGAIEYKTDFSWQGRLTNLNLYNAEIVKDTISYFEYNAVQREFYTDKKGVKYEFRNMNSSIWKQFVAVGGNKSSSYYITEDIGDYVYTLHAITRPRTIGMYMFEDCENLQHIILPHDLQRIELCAFNKCKSLQEIKIPTSVNFVGNQVFTYCYSLEEAKFHKDTPLRNLNKLQKGNSAYIFNGCSPDLKIVFK